MSFPRPILILALSWLSATAQQPLPAPPGVPVPGANAAPAAGAPNVFPSSSLPPVNPAIPLGDNKITEAIVEPKLSGNALSVLYRCYTGRRVIVTSAAATAEFSFVQDASVKEPLTFAQAAELLKKTAILENFVFVPHPNDPKIDVLTLSTAVKGPQIGVATYNNEADLPEGDAVISYVMTLSYIKPAEAVNTFTQIIGQFGALGSIVPVANASAVVITENTSLIRKLIDLKKEIDKPSGQVASRFIKVQYADVTEIADTLTTLLTAQQSAQKTAGVQRANTPGVTPASPQAFETRNTGVTLDPNNNGGSSEENPPQIVPEPRTNRIFVMGRPVDIIFVEGLIREFDIPTSEKTFMRRKLRFLTVSEFLPIAGDALTRAFTGTSDGGAGTAGAAGGQGGSNRNSSSNRNQSTGRSQTNGSSSSRNSNSGSSFGSGNSSFGGMGGSSGGGGMSGGGSALSDPSISSAPESLLVGRTLLVADNITNSVVAQGPPSALEIIERLLDQIDVKPDQIMISTVIGQLTLDDTHETGMDYLINSGDIVSRGGGGMGPVLPILNRILPAVGAPGDPDYVPAQSIFNPGTLPSGGGLHGYGQVGDLHIFLKALQSKTDFTVLSRPSIFANNNQRGTISSGERIAIPTQGGSNAGGYNSGTSIQYQDVVLKLEVIPLVNDNKTITMQIAMLNDEVAENSQVIAGAGTDGGNLTVPRIITREILTTATIPNSQTIVLGGLITNKDTQSKSGIPILSDIPYLGRLFSDVSDKKVRSELMVFIQPSIVDSERSLDDVQSAMNNRYKVSGKVRGFADGPGVLPAVDEIPRVETVGKNSAAPKAQAVDSAPRKAVKNNQPIFRR